jgi:hypothetical protein
VVNLSWNNGSGHYMEENTEWKKFHTKIIEAIKTEDSVRKTQNGINFTPR